MDTLVLQETIVSQFAQLLGCKAAGSGSTSSGITTVNGVSTSASPQDFMECLSTAVGGSDVVATVPSLEMKTEQRNTLPQVGEHRGKQQQQLTNSTAATAAAVTSKPEMAASVLSEASAEASKLEQTAATTLGNPTSWTKSTLVFAPQAMSKSISTSFSSLVESRVRAWTLLLLRHSLTTGDSASRSRLLSMLSSNIELKSAETTFKTLPLPDSARMQPKEADVILPMLFEAMLQISVQGKTDTVPLRAPGTIAGHFSKDKDSSKAGLIKAEIRLDTTALLESMVEQARLIVFKSVARATSINVDPKPKKNETTKIAATTETQQRSLSSFSSVLNLSADVASQNPRIQKARSSALRLNSILQGKSSDVARSSLCKIRKNRSVQWENNPMEGRQTSEAPAAKRQRLVQSQARLRSMKSFGRPHAESRRENKNATFGDFRSFGASMWGRDGKLLHHPVPGLTSSRMSNLNMARGGASGILNGSSGSGGGGSQNATFDIGASRVQQQQQQQQQRRISSNLGATFGFARPNKPTLNSGLPSTLPRTATALESWLMNNATKGKR